MVIARVRGAGHRGSVFLSRGVSVSQSMIRGGSFVLQFLIVAAYANEGSLCCLLPLPLLLLLLLILFPPVPNLIPQKIITFFAGAERLYCVARMNILILS